MSSHLFFDHLFNYSQQVTPYLKGELAPIENLAIKEPTVHIEQSSAKAIQELYENLKQAHPEAGAPYWLTRTWSLLCWQPIAVAFVAVYFCRGLPKISSIEQKTQPLFISGYRFHSTDYMEGSTKDLIAQAGKELNLLFEYFREEISQWTRIRPGFTKHLFADGILGYLIQLSQMRPDLSGDYLLEQAQLWLNACHLPETLLSSLTYNEETKQLFFVRTSCCLVYKCEGRKLCDNCPRQTKNRQRVAR